MFKWFMFILLGSCILLLNTNITFAFGNENISYDYISTDILRISNSKETYYINLSNGIQFSNKLPPNQEASHRFCAGFSFELSSLWNVICTNELSFSRQEILSDNLTYVNVTFSRGIISASGNATFYVTYNLKHNDAYLYSMITISNNMSGGFKIKPLFSWVLENISLGGINNDVLELNHSSYNLNSTLDLLFKNIDENGYRVYDTQSRDYISFAFDPLKEHTVQVKNNPSYSNAPVNVTIYESLLSSGTSKDFSFKYLDPAGDCMYLGEIRNGSLGCVGNQFTYSSQATDLLTGGTGGSYLAFRFNNTIGNLSCDGGSFKVTATSGGGQLHVGLMYDNSGTTRPNGTWVHNWNVSGNFLTGMQNVNFINPYNITQYQVYHFYFDGDPMGAGVTKTIAYINPKILKLPFDYSDQNQMIVAQYNTKWATRTTASPLFQLLCNYTSSLQTKSTPIGWTYDSYTNPTIGGNTVVGQFFKVPFKVNSRSVGFQLRTLFTAPQDNITFTLINNDTGQNITNGMINYTYTTSLQWVDGNYTGNVNVTLYPSTTYLLKLYCNSCSGAGQFMTEYIGESVTWYEPYNSSWGSDYGFYGSSTNNGSTWTVISSADLGFRIKGDKNYCNLIPNSNNLFDCLDNCSFFQPINFQNNNITVNNTNRLNGTIHFNNTVNIQALLYEGHICDTYLEMRHGKEFYTKYIDIVK